jgi:hypothetical protein
MREEPIAQEQEWRPLNEAPRVPGKKIRIRIAWEVSAFWDEELGRFVISRGPINIESVFPTDNCTYRREG